MRDKKDTTRRKGQPHSYDRGSGATLACCLGIGNLRHLTDEDTRDLIEFIRYFITEAYADGFYAGYSEAESYTCDAVRLLSDGPLTEH